MAVAARPGTHLHSILNWIICTLASAMVCRGIGKFAARGGGDNLFLASIVALDPDTGDYIWHYQTTPGDTWDYTAVQHMILADIEISGAERKVLMQAPKNGFFYVIDRETGKPISAEPFVPLNWATHVDLETGRPVETPGARYVDEHKVIFPSSWGGHNWHPMSYSPMTGLVYIPAIGGPEAFANPSDFTYHPNQLNTGINYERVAALPDSEYEDLPQINVRISAWDPVTQQERFRIDSGSGWNAGVLSTAGNLIFQGEGSGEFAAYRADTGEQLWSGFAGTAIQAAPVTYSAGGEQYVSVVAGWGVGLGSFEGDPAENPKLDAIGRVLTFKLGGNGKLPPATIINREQPDLPDIEVSDEQLQTGIAVYSARCSWCHGAATVGTGSFPDLRYASADVHANWNAIVLDGAFIDKGMPAFGEVFTEEEALALQAYVVQQARLLFDEE